MITSLKCRAFSSRSRYIFVSSTISLYLSPSATQFLLNSPESVRSATGHGVIHCRCMRRGKRDGIVNILDLSSALRITVCKKVPGGARYAWLVEKRVFFVAQHSHGDTSGTRKLCAELWKRGTRLPRSHRGRATSVDLMPKYQPAASPFDIGLYTVSDISMTDKRVWRASGCAIKRKSNDPHEIYRICGPFRWARCQYRCFGWYQFRQCSA